MILVLTGSREFQEYHLPVVQERLNRLFPNPGEVRMFVGDARGLDTLALNIDTIGDGRVVEKNIFKADWDTHGKQAGFKRNSEMVHAAEAATERIYQAIGVAFLIRELPCRGTRHCMHECDLYLSSGAFAQHVGILEGVTEEFINRTHTKEVMRLVKIASGGAFYDQGRIL